VRSESIKYLQAFLVKDSALTSPINQQGTRDAEKTLNKSKIQAKKG
jgi:hypothetical protein